MTDLFDNPFLHDLLTGSEVAGLLRLRPSTVADLARRGELPSIKLGRHRRYVRDDVAAFVQARRQTT
jgi:excisionase family DNA binding protein